MAHQRIPIDLAALFAPQSPTFESLPQWYDLGGHCSNCEREGWIDRWKLARRHGEATRIADLRPLLRCMKCGNKGSNTWIVAQVAR
jgi:hypothetical protein